MINLLPWRAALRIKQRQNFFKLLLGISCLTGMLIVFYHIYLLKELKRYTIKQQQFDQQASQLAQELNSYQKQQQQIAPIVANTLFLKQSQINQTNLLNFLQALPFLLPQNLNLTELSLGNRQLVISGIANKYRDITQLLKNLELEQQVKQVKLLKNPSTALAKDTGFKISLILSSSSVTSR